MIKKTIAATLALMLMLLSGCVLAQDDAKDEVVQEEVAQDEVPTFAGLIAENLNGDGEPIDDSIFANARITLVNYWTTWCPPCIKELPDLAKIQEATDGKVQVVGVLIDAFRDAGMRDEKAIEAMHKLVEDAGATYPMLYPLDEQGILMSFASVVTAVPTTFVVDETGKLLTYTAGSRTMEQWIALAEEQMEKLPEPAPEAEEAAEAEPVEEAEPVKDSEPSVEPATEKKTDSAA